MIRIEELKAEMELVKDDEVARAKLAESCGFEATEHPCRMCHGEIVIEWAAVLFDGKTSREVFATKKRAKVHAMDCLVAHWGF